MSEDELVSVNEAAGKLRSGRTTVYKLLREGAIRGVKRGRNTLISMASVREYLSGLPSYRPLVKSTSDRPRF